MPKITLPTSTILLAPLLMMFASPRWVDLQFVIDAFRPVFGD